jgi:hypothetical protein
MTKLKKVQLAWKHRRALWKHRKLIRHRKEILAGVSVAAAAILATVLLKRGAHS